MKRNVKTKALKLLVSAVLMASLILSFTVTTSALAYVNGPMFKYESGGVHHFEVVAYASSDENPVWARAEIGWHRPGYSFVLTNWAYESSPNPTTVMAVTSDGFGSPYDEWVSAGNSIASDGT